MLNQKSCIVIFGLIIYSGINFAQNEPFTKKEIENAISNVLQMNEQNLDLLCNSYKKMSPQEKRGFIKFLKQKLSGDPAALQHMEYLQTIMIAQLAFLGLQSYLEFSKKAGQVSFFSTDQEREKFEKAIFHGELLGLSTEEKGVQVVRINNEFLIFRLTLENVMEHLAHIAQDLEKQKDVLEQLFNEEQEQTEKQPEEEIPAVLVALFEKYATELKDEFLYSLLFLHLKTRLDLQQDVVLLETLKKI